VISIGFNLLELIKEIIISSLDLVPFASFWFFFGFLSLNCGALLISYRWQKQLQ
jgi:hypothetical protein